MHEKKIKENEEYSRYQIEQATVLSLHTCFRILLYISILGLIDAYSL